MNQDPDRLDVLTSTANEPDAALIVAALSDAGIEAVAEGGLTSGLRAEVPGEVLIVVKHRDLDQAKQVLDEFRRGDSDVDWSQVDLGEPEA